MTREDKDSTLPASPNGPASSADPADSPGTDSRRPDLAIGVGLALGFFGLYALTLCRTVFWYDSAEYATAAAVLGIPHPPGYPLYTLIAHLFTYLPMEPAAAVNAMSAVFAALAVGLSYGLLRELGAGRVASIVGAAALGASRLFWSQAVIAEVYTPAIAALTAVTWLVVRGRRLERERLIVTGALVAGLGLGLHLSLATCGLGLAFLVVSRGCASVREVFSRAHLRQRALLSLGCVGAAFTGSLIFLYLPLRARMEPILNFGDPSSWKNFWWHVTGGNYKNWFGDIDRGERARLIAELFYDQLLVIGCVLAVLGLMGGFLARRMNLQRERSIVTLALIAMMLGNLIYFFDYRVHDIEVFFLPSIAVLCWLVGLGTDVVLTQVAARVRPEKNALVQLVAGVFLLFPLLLIPANYTAVDLSEFDDAERYGDLLVEGLPEGAVIINFTTPPEWKTDAVFGFYYQKVKRQRLDVRITQGAPRARQVIELLQKGVPVYLYHPVEPMLRLFRVAPDGPLYRVLGPRAPGPE